MRAYLKYFRPFNVFCGCPALRPDLCDSHETDRHPPDVVFYAKKTAIGTPAAGDQHSECEKERSFGRYLDPLPGFGHRFGDLPQPVGKGFESARRGAE